jgi:hypothetical protein
MIVCSMISAILVATSCTGKGTTITACPSAAHLFAKAWIHDNTKRCVTIQL